MRDTTLVIPAAGARDIAHGVWLAQRCGMPRWVIKDEPYGQAIKSGIRLCATPYMATMDADGQHTLEHVQHLIEMKRATTYHMLVGMRVLWKARLPNVGLNLLASVLAGQWVTDLGSGLRIFDVDAVDQYVPILPDGFDFNTALTMCLLSDGLDVAWLPMSVRERQWGTSSTRPVQDGMRALWQIVRIGGALRTRTLRRWTRPVTKRGRWIFRL